MKKIIVVFLMLILWCSVSYAARSITLPYEMKFDSGDNWTSDLAWKGGVGCDSLCTITDQSALGWSGGAAKIVPPQVACCDGINGCMCALGSFTGFSTTRLNIRALYRFGPTYYSSFRNAGGGLYNKFIDVHNTSSVRMGIFYLIADGPSGAWYGLFNGGCAWWNDIPGCRLGSPLVALTATENNNQWVSLEYELNSGGVTKAYMYKSDGTYATWTSQDTIPSGNMSQIEIGGFHNEIHAVDSGTWVLIDELKISNTYIGPPTGFVGGADTTPPTITNVTSSKANGSYRLGEVIPIAVTFSEAVTSVGNVTVTLETGATDRTCTFTVTNSSTGTCNYTVQAGDTSSDLNVNTISGTINDQAANAMVNFTIPSGYNLANNKAIVIDTTVPTLSTKTIASNGTTLTLVFSEPIVTSSSDNAAWSLSASVSGATTASYVSGTGTNTIIYTLNKTIKIGETVTISYSGVANGVEDVALNDLAAIVSSAVTNNSTQPLTYTITSTAGTGGSISPLGSTIVNSGGSQSYSATVSTGYIIRQLVVDGVNQGSISAYTFSNVVANHTISLLVTLVAPTAATGFRCVGCTIGF